MRWHFLSLHQKTTMRFLFSLSLLIFVFACNNQSTDTAVNTQSPQQEVDSVLIMLGPLDFDTLLNTKRNIMLFDLRPASEFAKGHIWRSTSMDATDPLFYHRLAALGVENEFALYDASGYLAIEAGRKMKGYGFKKIYVLREGLMTWGEAGRALQLN
jgi:rhodanese-related sulfurtransferase